MSKPSKQLKLVIKAGQIRSIYDDALTAMFPSATVEIKRASHVEPVRGLLGTTWAADLSPVNGPILQAFPTRQEALDAEAQYINQHVIK